MKVRPCPKSDRDGAACGRPCMKGKRQCRYHWLMAQPPDAQAEQAAHRLRLHNLTGKPPRARVPKEEWPDGERWCAGCQSFVPLFYASGSRCKACASSAARAARVEKVYGITADQEAALLRRQGGRCAICRNKPRSMRLAVDHDHQTGEVRGLLCKRCNHDLLGGGHDDPTLLWAAIGYLLFPPAKYDPATIERGHVLAALDERLNLKALLAQRTPAEPQEPPF